MSRTRCRRSREFIGLGVSEPGLMCKYRAGGVTIVGGNGKIDINNTFEERLRLLESDALPSIRTTLFGENQNRKFRD